ELRALQGILRLHTRGAQHRRQPVDEGVERQRVEKERHPQEHGGAQIRRLQKREEPVPRRTRRLVDHERFTAVEALLAKKQVQQSRELRVPAAVLREVLRGLRPEKPRDREEEQRQARAEEEDAATGDRG